MFGKFEVVFDHWTRNLFTYQDLVSYYYISILAFPIRSQICTKIAPNSTSEVSNSKQYFIFSFLILYIYTLIGIYNINIALFVLPHKACIPNIYLKNLLDTDRDLLQFDFRCHKWKQPLCIHKLELVPNILNQFLQYPNENSHFSVTRKLIPSRYINILFR